jgi:hypothetical protein
MGKRGSMSEKVTQLDSRRAKPGVTITELQEQIARVEGFRVSFGRFGAQDAEIPPYAFDVAAPSKWTVADWKQMRLGAYVLIFKSVDVYRGDETVAKPALRLVTLRDSYYLARYGTLEPEPAG